MFFMTLGYEIIIDREIIIIFIVSQYFEILKINISLKIPIKIKKFHIIFDTILNILAP